jgi:anti-sigma regulatory factor (Ser/Thr protein kinase)
MVQSLSLPRAFTSLDEMFAFLDGCYREHGVDDRAAFCVNLAAEELFTNMVRHNVSDSAAISLETEIDGDRILLRLKDFDVEPFDPEAAPTADVDAPMEKRTPGGLGLHLVRSMVDEVAYAYDAKTREIQVTVTKLRGEKSV